MKAHLVSLINAALLVLMGIWGYISSGAVTALIPVVIGVILLVLNSGIKKENKVIAHIAVSLTLLILFGLLKPFITQITKVDMLGILRVGLMMASTVWALVAFIKSFIAARKAKEASAEAV
jgi:hypothetical protein